MNFKTVSKYVGYALLVSALFMLFSVGVSLLDGRDSAYGPLLVSFLIARLRTSFRAGLPVQTPHECRCA